MMRPFSTEKQRPDESGGEVRGLSASAVVGVSLLLVDRTVVRQLELMLLMLLQD